MQKEILQVKLNIILAWSRDPENLSNKEGLTKTQAPTWEREIEKSRLGVCEVGNKRDQVEEYWKNDWFYGVAFKGQVANSAIETQWNLREWLYYMTLSNGGHEVFTGHFLQASRKGIK